MLRLKKKEQQLLQQIIDIYSLLEEEKTGEMIPHYQEEIQYHKKLVLKELFN